MRTLLNYLRSCFCKHDWEELDHSLIYGHTNRPIGDRWTYRCKKCGCFKTYKNY